MARTEKLNVRRAGKPIRPGLAIIVSEETVASWISGGLLSAIRRWRVEREERKPQG